MFEEITSIVEEKFKDLYTVNKYAVLKIARSRTGEFVRYRDVRDEIDEIIFDVANVLELDLEKRFMKSPEGNVYMEYIPYEREVEDDDSDIYDDSDEDDKIDNDSDDSDEDDKIDNDSDDSDDSDEDELIYYTTIVSQGRIYIPSDVRVKFDIDATDTWVFRDPERKEIVLNGVDLTSEVNLEDHAMLYVAKTLGLREGDEVKMYDTNEGVIIEPK
jgi:bifunctional DNA-binding transcriptional regulator/antitoxin component of YhaV-PrlF toxin-antitoxin module